MNTEIEARGRRLLRRIVLAGSVVGLSALMNFGGDSVQSRQAEAGSPPTNTPIPPCVLLPTPCIRESPTPTVTAVPTWTSTPTLSPTPTFSPTPTWTSTPDTLATEIARINATATIESLRANSTSTALALDLRKAENEATKAAIENQIDKLRHPSPTPLPAADLAATVEARRLDALDARIATAEVKTATAEAKTAIADAKIATADAKSVIQGKQTATADAKETNTVKTATMERWLTATIEARAATAEAVVTLPRGGERFGGWNFDWWSAIIGGVAVLIIAAAAATREGVVDHIHPHNH